MMSDGGRRNIAGIVGCGISCVAYLLAGKPFYQTYRAGAVQEKFQPYAELLAALSSFLWMYYSLPFMKKNYYPFMAINGFGFLINLVYLGVFCTFAAKRRRLKLVYATTAVAAVTSILIMIAMFLVTSRTARVHYVAVLGDIGSIAASFYSLLSWQTVYMRALLCDIVGALLWTLYAFQSPSNYYIVVASVVRVVFGAVQIILHVHTFDPKPIAPEASEPTEHKGCLQSTQSVEED